MNFYDAWTLEWPKKKQKVGNVLLPGAAPVTYRKITLHAKNGLPEQYFKVLQECTILSMLYNGVYVQHCPVGSHYRFRRGSTSPKNRLQP